MSFSRKISKKVFIFCLCGIISGCASSVNGNDVTSCKSSAPFSSTETSKLTTWKINTDLTSSNIPEHAEKAFRQCYPDGDSFQPLVLFGTETSSGTNDIVLCYEKDESLAVVTIHEDSDGNGSVISVMPFDLDEVTENTEEPNGSLDTAAFEMNDDAYAQAIPEEVLDALSDVSSDSKDSSSTNHRISGNTVRTVIFLGTEKDTGTNYAVLCIIYPENKNPYWAVITVHVNEENKGEYSIISPINPLSFTDNEGQS